MNKNEQEKYLIEIRREKVYELHAKGYSNTEISNMLSEHVSEPTVSRDLTHLKRRARENFRNWVDKELLNEYQKTLVGLTCIMKEARSEARTSTGRNKIHALDLAQRAYQLRLELLTNNTVVEDSVRFIEGVKKRQEKKESEPIEQEEEEQEQELIEEE